MKIVNILFNFKKSANENKVLGVERCFIDYSKYFSSLGHEVVSVMQGSLSFVSKLEEIGEVRTMRAFSQLDFLTMIKMFWLFIRFRPEIIICHSRRALYFAKIARFFAFLKAPIIVINHGIRVEKFLKADYVFSVNSYFTAKLIELGMDKNHAIAIPNMIEVAPDFTPIVKNNFGKIIRIGALGRLYPEKNFDKILLAMKILKDENNIDCEFTIGGTGPQLKVLEKIAQENGLEKNLKVLGWVENKKEFFENIDIFILPSFGETFGIVLLEAMLYNTPIITSNSWGPDEIIENEFDGLKVSKDDPKLMPRLLSQAILKLYQDEEFAKKLAKNAHKKLFEKYEANVVIRNLEKIFKRILNENKNNL